MALLVAPSRSLLLAESPRPGCDSWSARPCWPSPALDCAFRALARDLGDKLLHGSFGSEALVQLEDAMQLQRYCPALPRTQRTPAEAGADAAAAAGGRAAPPCSYSGATSGKVYAVAASGGDDGGPGTLSAPFATPARAVAASRQRAAVGEGATIVLLPGTHYLANETMELDERDSGLVLTGCEAVAGAASPLQLPTTLSAGRALNASGVWEAVPGEPRVSMMRHAFGPGRPIDGLFLSSASANVRMVRARHPNSDPERVIWPSSAPADGAQQYPAEQYIGPQLLRYPESRPLGPPETPCTGTLEVLHDLHKTQNTKTRARLMVVQARQAVRCSKTRLRAQTGSRRRRGSWCRPSCWRSHPPTGTALPAGCPRASTSPLLGA